MTTFVQPVLDRSAALERFDRIRARTRRLFALLDEGCYYERPIALRNPVVFYEGHLPAFAVNTLLKKGLGHPGIDPGLEVIFARGIDPDAEAHAVARGNPAWPSRDTVGEYVAAAERELRQALATADLERPGHPLLDRAEAVFTILEHEEMHQETLAYMWHQVPHARKRAPEGYVTATPESTLSVEERQRRVTVPGGPVLLGTGPEQPFSWDNERPPRAQAVDPFVVEAHDVTNAAFLEFVDAGGYRDPRWWRAEDWEWVQAGAVSHPPFWVRQDGAWQWRGMFAFVPLPATWPVYVTWAEANAFARWRGGRLMTEAEYVRAARGARPGRNTDFHRWDPEPVGSDPASVSDLGVHDLMGNGWEWTSSVFAPFPGFQAMPSYPEYSAEFFDEDHFVMKGASPVTPRALVRPGFRNWFRPRYPYVYATFRCAWDAPAESGYREGER